MEDLKRDKNDDGNENGKNQSSVSQQQPSSPNRKEKVHFSNIIKILPCDVDAHTMTDNCSNSSNCCCSNNCSSCNAYDYNDTNNRNNDSPSIMRRVSSNGIIRSSRVVSLDSSSYLSSTERKRHDTNNITSVKKRATSLSSSNKIDKYLMRRITFEEVEVNSTPLSQMRSCSEFMADSSIHNNNSQENDEYKNNKKSRFFSKYFLFSVFTKNNKNSSSKTKAVSSLDNIRRKNKAVINDDDERRFFIENLTGANGTGFNEYYNYDTEDDDYSNTLMSGRDLDKYGRPSCFSFNLSSNDKKGHIFYEHRRSIEADINPIEFARRLKQSRLEKQKKSKTSLMDEMTSVLDIVFAYNSNYRRGEPMEIELKEFSNSAYTSNEIGSGVYDGIDRGDIPSANVHQRTIDRIVSEIVNGRINQYTINNDIPTDASLNWTLKDSSTWLPAFLILWNNFKLVCKRNFIGPGDDAYYELIRIQPFSSGAYIRGILASGFSSLFFNAYSLALWPDFAEIMPTRRNTISVMFWWLIFQLLLNLLQFPLRLKLHFNCWESSRAVDVESAVTHLRNMVQSDAWLLNRVLGRIQDLITIFSILVSEVFLWTTNTDDPLRHLVNSLIATNMLALIVRIFAITAFSISMHDPTVLAEARKRGLSRWDIEGLPTFVFTNLEEVNNGDCSICLSPFDLGDMLISLPCDSKHSFHAHCIRQWLTRQNSCPLCQRLC